MVINKKVSEMWKFLILQDTFFLLKFVGTVFIGTVFVGIVFLSSIISSHVITESSVILAKYLPFLRLYVAGFQI